MKQPTHKNILVLVPDGTGIKNYLYTKVFRNKAYKIGLLHSFDSKTYTDIASKISIDYQFEIPKYKESVREKFLRELIHKCRIKYNARLLQNPSIHEFWNKKPKSLKLRLFYKAVVFTSLFYNSYAAILRLEKKYNRAITKNSFYQASKTILQSAQPDHIFCTHQRALTAPTIFKVAKDLGIPTTTVIYSWDNLPKARLALQADNYLVWSDYMKKELLQLYPEIPTERVIVTGTPQFEFYYDTTTILPKDNFYERYQLDQNKKIICFSGDDVRTSPRDPQYLCDLAEAITQSSLQDEVQILFRRCPVDVSGRYDWVLQQYPDLIREAPPLWNHTSEKWTTIYPTLEDVNVLVSTAYYCDLVVNVGSTMAFDFGVFNKPCAFINYDIVKDPNWSVDTIYQFQHFRSMPSKEAVYWLSSKAEIISVVSKALEHPKTQIDNWYSIVVNHPKLASENIQKVLNACT